MTTPLRPHDLIWLTTRDALEGITESWVEALAYRPAGGGAA
jgi:phosphoribosyl-dephospho-CoA transferase